MDGLDLTLDLFVAKINEMARVRASDYTKIGEITYQELLAYSESFRNKKKADLISVFVEYAYKKFELSQYVLRSQMNEAIFLKENEAMMFYEVYLKKKYIENEEDIIDEVKKIIGLQE